MTYYYQTPTHCVAFNANAGSSSLARAIIQAHYPKQEHLIRTAAFPAGMDASKRQWHWLCPGTRAPDKPVVLLVRDPVERFRSACQQVGIQQEDVDAAIESLVSDKKFVRTKGDKAAIAEMEARQARRESLRAARQAAGKPTGPQRRPGHLRDDPHFRRQSDCCCGDTCCYRFPQDIPAAAEALGLGEVPQENVAKRPKPTLSTAQAAAVRAYYADDQSLYDAISEPGHVHAGEH